MSGAAFPMMREQAARDRHGLAQTLDSVMSDWFARHGW
jgi:hypothetical protein